MVFPQCSPSNPAGYTDYLGLRYWNDGDDPCADSLFANLDDIDDWAETTDDTLSAVKSDLYTSIDYSGNIRSATIDFDDLKSAAKSVIVQTSGNQSISGIKTWSNAQYFDALIRTHGLRPSATNTWDIGAGYWNRYDDIYAKMVHVPRYRVVSSTDTTVYAEFTMEDSILHISGNTIFEGNLTFDDSASTDMGAEDTPLDTVFTQGVVMQNDGAIIAQANDGRLSPPDSIWYQGVLIKPGILHYDQNYTVGVSTTSITAKSEVIILSVLGSGGSLDTLYIGDELWTTQSGTPFITIYNRSSTTFTITDTDGAGYNYAIRLPGVGSDIVLGQFDLVELFFDANSTQWVLKEHQNND